MGWIQYVLFYLIWVYVGLFYEELKNIVHDIQARKKIFALSAVSILLLLILSFLGQSLNMQQNKFPPNVVFLLYSMCLMSLILYNLPILNAFFARCEQSKQLRKIVNAFSTKSMTVFLYQVFAFNVTIRLSHLLIPRETGLASISKAVLCFVITVPLCYLFTLVFGGVEKWPNIWLDKRRARK